MPEDVQDVDLIYPTLGVDQAYGFNSQRQNTSRSALNTRSFDSTTDRQRGGRRPGLARSFADRIPEGSELIQQLSTIVIGDTSALLDSGGPPIEWGGGIIDDPSDGGAPGSHGTGTIGHGWDGTPITGDTLTPPTRNPGPRKTRKKGTGIQPGKNHLQLDPPNGVYYLFQGQAQVTINDPGPFFGTTPLFVGCMCVGQLYLALGGPPVSAENFPSWWRALHAYFTLHGIAEDYTYDSGSTLITGPIRVCTPADFITSACDKVTGFEGSGDHGP